MTIATIRQDGYPQATTVSYANDGLDIYFGCSEDSQKARNISRNGKVSLTINLPYANWGEIRGISAGGHADRLTDPQRDRAGGTAPAPEIPSRNCRVCLGRMGVAFFKVVPKVISVLDYRKGFGHTDLVSNEPAPSPVSAAEPPAAGAVG